MFDWGYFHERKLYHLFILGYLNVNGFWIRFHFFWGYLLLRKLPVVLFISFLEELVGIFSLLMMMKENLHCLNAWLKTMVICISCMFVASYICFLLYTCNLLRLIPLKDLHVFCVSCVGLHCAVLNVDLHIQMWTMIVSLFASLYWF